MSTEISPTRRKLVCGAALTVVAAPILAAASRGFEPAAVTPPCDNDAAREGISIADFGARGDGADQTAAFTTARDAIQSRGSNTLRFPAGDYRLNAVLDSRLVHLAGAGNMASVVRSASRDDAIIRATHSIGAWEGTRLSDMGFEGVGRRQGVGFRAGGGILTPFIEYTGRFLFDRVRFHNLEKGIERPFGNIGFDITDCVFADTEFHVWSQGQAVSSAENHPMHAGCLTITRGSMRGAQRAAVYINGKNVVGAGQVVFDSVRFEHNPGWALFVRDFNDRGPQPGIVVRNCWNESNYSAPKVRIDGDEMQPGFARLINVPAIAFEDTPIGPLVLENSHVVTRGCNLDLLVSLAMDARSSLIHHDARMYSGTARGLVRSISHLENTDAKSSLNTPWFPMPVSTGRRMRDQSVLVASNAQAPEQWGGSSASSTSVAEVALPWLANSQQLPVAPGAKLVSPASLIIPANQWFAVQFLARLVSGPAPQVHINGTAGFGGVGHIRDSHWRTYTAVIQNTGSAIGGEYLYIYSGGTEAAVIRFGGYAVTSFDNSQEALTFANSLLFPVT